MYSQCWIFFILIILSNGNRTNKPTTLNIGALFDFDHLSKDNGRHELQAAQIAIHEINLRQKDLFNGLYTLTLLSNNSRCDPVYAVDAFFHAIFRRPQLHFLVGTSCSNETKAVIQVADYYNLILFSHSTSFISQANESYSTLVRLSVSDENYNDARVAFVKYNNWSHVAIIHQDSIEHSLMMAKLAKSLNESNINVLLTQSASWFNLTSALQNLRTAHHLQQKLRLKGHLDRQTLHAYDAIWVIALLIRASIDLKISIDEFTYNSVDIRDEWLNLIEQIHFLGVSGPVSFRNRQRRAETIISQFQIDLNRPRIRTIAEYSHVSGFNINCTKCRPLLWPNKIPVDTERSEIRRVVLKIAEIIFITVACILGLALAIFFLTFNIIHRHERYIKLSSSKLNNVMVIGAMHIHIAILLFGFDQWFLEHNILGHACILRIFLFSGGFSLTFGSMFLKTLRVYRIFTSHDRPLLHSKLLQDYYLLLICLHIYSIDVICTIVWQFLDPHFIEFTYGSIRRLDMDTVVSDEIYHCNSKYRQKILPFIYFYKSLFLVVGGYLAAKTRHVHISALNDSKFIVWSIYIVVLTSLFTFIVMISIRNLHTYIVLCFVVIIMTSVIICLVFLPKVLALKSRNREEVVSKELYMDDSRTRRLAVEISYFEAYRYAQLQNRELKTELVRLNHTLSNLQQTLDSASSNVTMALLPLAVRLASTLLQKPDIQTPNPHLNNKSTTETDVLTKEEISTVINTNNENEKESINDTTSSNNLLGEFEQTLFSSSSSSELDLSIALQSLNDTSSLSLTSLDNQQNLITDDDENISLTPIRIKSDDESVLYLRLSDELNIAEATFDSDLDRIDR
ncbi:unnamed protein product [Rotaria sp. Silwood2]|nr:unnamed protein product [Rotaria sp. Silwood2]